MENQKLVKINPADYGLQESKAKQISDMFKPMLDEMVTLEKEYNEVTKLEVSDEACALAKELRLKYVKVRTGTADIHKELKLFYLQGGRFVDGWKNAQLMASQGIEGKLKAIEDHYENIELERVTKLQEERRAKIIKYIDDEIMIPADLGKMTDDVFNNYFAGVKAAYEARVAAEKKAEEDRIAREKAEEEERERIRVENEKLRKDNEAKEKQLEAERKEAEAKRMAAENKARWDREEAEAKLKEEQEARDKIEAELIAKKVAEEAEKNRLIEEERKAKAAPDNDKLNALAKTINELPLPELEGDQAKYVLDTVKNHLSKVSNYIYEKTANV